MQCRIFGTQYLFHVVIRADLLLVDAVKLDDDERVEIFFEPGLPDFQVFKRAFHAIVFYRT
jgi:hypothetical protein